MDHALPTVLPARGIHSCGQRQRPSYGHRPVRPRRRQGRAAIQMGPNQERLRSRWLGCLFEWIHTPPALLLQRKTASAPEQPRLGLGGRALGRG